MFPDEEDEIKVLKRLLDSFTALTKRQAVILSALLKNWYCTDKHLSALSISSKHIRGAVSSINKKLARANAGVVILSFNTLKPEISNKPIRARMLAKVGGQ